jgi:hypothetical protein
VADAQQGHRRGGQEYLPMWHEKTAAEHTVPWPEVRGAADALAPLLAEVWEAGFMDAAGQDHPAYPRTRRIDNPYERAERIGGGA